MSESIKDVLIEELDLSVRTYNCLKRARINTIDDITNCTEEDFMKIRNLSRKSMEEVKSKVSGFKKKETELEKFASNFEKCIEEGLIKVDLDFEYSSSTIMLEIKVNGKSIKTDYIDTDDF